MAHLPEIENIYTFLKQSMVDILQMIFFHEFTYFYEFNMFPFVRVHSLLQSIRSCTFHFFVSWKECLHSFSRDKVRQCGVLVISTPQCPGAARLSPARRGVTCVDLNTVYTALAINGKMGISLSAAPRNCKLVLCLGIFVILCLLLVRGCEG